MLTIFILIEPISKIMTGIITGLGRQGIASIFTLVAYWAVGIPLTLIYVFELNGGIFAIWLGATLSIVFILFASYIIMIKTDFQEQAELSQARRVKEMQKYQTLDNHV